MEKELVGAITHYFDKAGVAVVDLKAPLSIGDNIVVESADKIILEQTVKSMQVEHGSIQTAEAGTQVGLKVDGQVHAGNKVYKLTE